MIIDERILKLAQAILDRAAILHEMGNTDEALSEYKNAYDLLPSLAAEPYAQAFYQRGQEKEKNGDNEGALRDFSAALEVVPEGQLKGEIQHRKTILENPLPAHPAVCPSCGKEIQAKWEFCPHCSTGLKLPVSPTECPQCGQQIQPEWELCPYCSYRIQPAGNAFVSSSTRLPASKPAPPQPLSTVPLPPPSTLLTGTEIPKLSILARPQDKRTAQPEAIPGPKVNRKITLALVSVGLIVLLILVVGISLLLEPSRSGILALIYSSTSTSAPTITPNYQATNSAATSTTSAATSVASTAISIANTTTASARFATETAQASATSGVKTVTAAFEQTRATATRAALQTQTKATYLAYQTTQRVIDALDQAVVQICQGKGEPGAANYVAKRAFHPIRIYPIIYPYPSEARPQELSQLELVACVEDSEKRIKSTSYTDGYVCEEMAHVAKITLRAAKSGSVIRTYEVRGPSPEPCANMETFSYLKSTKTKVGGPIDVSQVWEKVKGVVFLELKGKSGPTSNSTTTPSAASASLPPSCNQVGLIWVSPMDGIELKCIPAGKFLRGSNSSDDPLAFEDEIPQTSVYLDEFWMDQTEVTNIMFEKFVNATQHKTQAEKQGSSVVINKQGEWILVPKADWRHPLGPTSSISVLGQHPVVHVGWDDAVAYCKWAGRRLPTEAEWEKAARGTQGAIYPWEDQLPTGELVNFGDANFAIGNYDKKADDGYKFTAPVGSFPAGKSVYGLFDMAGNVWEWVADWYSDTYYSQGITNNPPGPTSGIDHIGRGGAFDATAQWIRAAVRIRISNSAGAQNAGFRCVFSK